MREEIKVLHQKLGTTIVYVTHDQIEAMTLADKIVILRDGRVEQIGSPLDLFDAPQNTFVAGFIGSPNMNLLDGEAQDDGLYLGTHRLGDCPPGVSDGNVTIGIRPDDLVMDADGITAEVILTEHTGSELYVLAEVGEQRISLSFRERFAITAGDRIGLNVAPERLHVFDRQTGKRLNPPATRKTSPAQIRATAG